MENFYDIIHSEGKKPLRAEVTGEHKFLGDPNFISEFGRGKEGKSFFFYLEGVECLACSWAFGNMDSVGEDILYTAFHPEDRVLEIETTGHLNALLKVAEFVEGLGYRLIPLKNAEEGKQKYRVERRAELVRIGVTAALLMNMMIYSVSLYAGAEGMFQSLFRHLVAILFVPIMLYSATPFYKNLWSQLCHAAPTLDIPIGLSIVLGSFLSYRNYFKGNQQFYFDSITMFIFLILSIRYFLSHIYRKEVFTCPLEDLYGEQQVVKIEKGVEQFKHISQIAKGDTIRVKKGEVAPLDGVILKGSSHFNESLITGESEPIPREKGWEVKSGSKNLTVDVDLIVTGTGETNSFHNYLSALRFDGTTLKGYAEFGGRYSVGLTLILFFISGGLFFFEGGQAASEKILSLFIICCPCALGIGIPLATLLKLKSLAKKGILIQDKSIFEKYPKIRKLCFDKTGTLTTGQYHIEQLAGCQSELKYLIALEKRSEHPVATFFCRHFASYDQDLNVENFVEIPGKGVEGDIDGIHFSIFSDQNGHIVMAAEGKETLKFDLKEIYDPEILSLLENFSRKFIVEILSGDSPKRVEKLMEHFTGNDRISAQDSLSPEEKKKHVDGQEDFLYIGDGLNDVWAMKKAALSISLNSSKLVNDVCSVTFLGGGVKKLYPLFNGTKHLHQVIRRNILLSALYNLLGIALVFQGYIGPLAAAILMPVSSLMVAWSCFIQEEGRAWKF